MSKVRNSPELRAYQGHLEELAALDARVDAVLLLNDPEQLSTLIAEMRDLGRRLREAKLALLDAMLDDSSASLQMEVVHARHRMTPRGR